MINSFRDNVEWDEELISQAEEKIKNNSSTLVPTDKAGNNFKWFFNYRHHFVNNLIKENFEKNAGEFWNKFYSIHGNYDYSLDFNSF